MRASWEHILKLISGYKRRLIVKCEFLFDKIFDSLIKKPPQSIMTLKVDDQTHSFTKSEKQELIDFVRNELLSTERDLARLKVIRIINRETNYLGIWSARCVSKNSSSSIFHATISLNCHNFYRFPPEQLIVELKEILAHEYGHHWTLIHFLESQYMINYLGDPLPETYYRIRNISTHNFAPDYSRSWEWCDKEVIAEDYRILFAPAPYNQDHQMICDYGLDLSYPDVDVKSYIQSLSQLVRNEHT